MANNERLLAILSALEALVIIFGFFLPLANNPLLVTFGSFLVKNYIVAIYSIFFLIMVIIAVVPQGDEISRHFSLAWTIRKKRPIIVFSPPKKVRREGRRALPNFDNFLGKLQMISSPEIKNALVQQFYAELQWKVEDNFDWTTNDKKNICKVLDLVSEDLTSSSDNVVIYLAMLSEIQRTNYRFIQPYVESLFKERLETLWDSSLMEGNENSVRYYSFLLDNLLYMNYFSRDCLIRYISRSFKDENLERFEGLFYAIERIGVEKIRKILGKQGRLTVSELLLGVVLKAGQARNNEKINASNRLREFLIL